MTDELRIAIELASKHYEGVGMPRSAEYIREHGGEKDEVVMCALAAIQRTNELAAAWFRERGDCWTTDDEVAAVIEANEHMKGKG